MSTHPFERYPGEFDAQLAATPEGNVLLLVLSPTHAAIGAKRRRQWVHAPIVTKPGERFAVAGIDFDALLAALGLESWRHTLHHVTVDGCCSTPCKGIEPACSGDVYDVWVEKGKEIGGPGMPGQPLIDRALALWREGEECGRELVGWTMVESTFRSAWRESHPSNPELPTPLPARPAERYVLFGRPITLVEDGPMCPQWADNQPHGGSG